MARKRAPFDLWQLFIEGRSSGVAFGETDVAGARKALGARSHGYEGRLPFSSWVLMAEQVECYFQGLPPRLYSVKIHPSLRSLSSEAAEVLDGEEASDERAGLLPVVLDSKPLSHFSTIGRLLRHCPDADKLSIRREVEEKLLSFSIIIGGRKISFGYRAEVRNLYLGSTILDFDYFLYAVWIFDMDVDARLSKTLPAETDTREAILSRIVSSGRRALNQEQTNN